MVPSVEIFDPRLGSWIFGEPMKTPRGYSAAVVIEDFIYVIGGIKLGGNIFDTVSYILLVSPLHKRFYLCISIL